MKQDKAKTVKCPQCGCEAQEDPSKIVVDAMKRPIGKVMVCPKCNDPFSSEEDDD